MLNDASFIFAHVLQEKQCIMSEFKTRISKIGKSKLDSNVYCI